MTIRKLVCEENKIEETTESRTANFLRLQKRMLELMKVFKELKVEEIDPKILDIYYKAFPEAVDCIEALCEGITHRK